MYSDDDYESDFEKYLENHPTIAAKEPFFKILDNSGAQLHVDGWGRRQVVFDDEMTTDMFDTTTFKNTYNSEMVPTCNLKECRVNRSLVTELQLAEERLKRERLKVRGQKEKRVKHRIKQKSYEDEVISLEERIRVLENQVSELSVRHATLGLVVVNLKADKERLTRAIFERSIGFPLDMPKEETNLAIDALVYHCLQVDGDADALASKYEMWNGNAEIKNNLYYLMTQYQYRWED